MSAMWSLVEDNTSTGLRTAESARLSIDLSNCLSCFEMGEALSRIATKIKAPNCSKVVVCFM